MRRRTALRFAGLGAVGALAGCVGDGDGDGDDDGSSDPHIAGTATIQLATHTSTPRWHSRSQDSTGHVVLIDSETRTEAALNQYAREMAESRRQELAAFMDEVRYGRDRLLLVESVGPDGCHDRLEVENVALEEGRLTADAGVVDTGDDEADCAEAVTYPSVLVRVTFEDDPPGAATVTITDGWGESSTVEATTDDPLAPDPVDLPGHIRPEGEPEPVEPLECDDEEFERLPQAFDEEGLQTGDLEEDDRRFSMRVAKMEYARGETARIELTNVSEGEVTTGTSEKFNLQVLTDDGWQDVRGSDEGPVPYTDEGVVHYPGGGFEWSFALTDGGVADLGSHDLRVCPVLPAGRYRLAYWGLAGADAEALAVEFDLLD